MRPEPRKRAFSLAETIAAILVLVSSLIVASVIFARSYAYFNRVEKATRATVLARRIMEEIRVEASTPDKFLAGVPVYASGTLQEGDLSVTTTVTPVSTPRRVPAISLGGLRDMPASYLQATVRVSWPEAPPEGVQLSTLLGEPPREPGTLTIAATPPTYTATLLDSNGLEIPEVTYRWSVLGARGKARPVPDASFAKTLTLDTVSAGDVVLRVKAVYNGQTLEAEQITRAL